MRDRKKGRLLVMSMTVPVQSRLLVLTTASASHESEIGAQSKSRYRDRQTAIFGTRG